MTTGIVTAVLVVACVLVLFGSLAVAGDYDGDEGDG